MNLYTVYRLKVVHKVLSRVNISLLKLNHSTYNQ